MDRRPSGAAAPTALFPSLLPLLLAVAFSLGLPAAGLAQSGGAASAGTPEAAVRGLFDAMREADSAAARLHLHPDARLARPVTEEGRTVLQVSGPEGWLNAIGGAEPGQLDEKIWNLEVRRDGDLATAWMRYAFYLGGELHHCGVNAFQLVRQGGGWRVFAVADTSREEGCEGPPDGSG